MGNAFGHLPENAYNRYFYPNITPGPYEKPTFDPNLGFKAKRKARVMKATDQEMKSAKIPLDKRDYCADKLIALKACRKDVWPFAVRCSHYTHDYLNCQYEDFVLRMKEYEREKRLRARFVK